MLQQQQQQQQRSSQGKQICNLWTCAQFALPKCHPKKVAQWLRIDWKHLNILDRIVNPSTTTRWRDQGQREKPALSWWCMVRAFLVYLRPDWGLVAIGECQRVTHATLRITHTNAQHTAYHAHTYTSTLSMTRNGRSFRRCVEENVDNFPVFQRCGYYDDCNQEFLYAALWMYVGFWDPNKDQRSWSTRSYCYYYYYLHPCIKFTSSELSAFILRVHFHMHIEKSLRKLVYQSRLWFWISMEKRKNYLSVFKIIEMKK